MTSEPNTPILEGATLEQARQRETLKVIGAILGLIVSIVVFVIWVPGGASSALRNATGNDAGLISRLWYVIAFLLISGLLEFPLGVYFVTVTKIQNDNAPNRMRSDNCDVA